MFLEMYFVPHVLKHRGYLMHNSSAVSIFNCAFDSPCFSFFYTGGPILFPENRRKTTIIHRLLIQAYVFFIVALLSSRPPQTMGNILHISIAVRKCLCASGKVVLCSKHFDIIIWVPMFCLKLFNHI